MAMERAAEVVEGLVRGQAVDGRCVYEASAKAELIRRCGEPGISIAATALAHGINANVLRRWIAEERRVAAGLSKRPWHRGAASGSAGTLVPVTVIEDPTVPSARPLSTPARTTRTPVLASAATSALQIEYRGAKLHITSGVSDALLERVLDCLARRALP